MKDLELKVKNKEPLTMSDFKDMELDEVAVKLEELDVVSTMCHEYGEPGYNNPKKEILFGDWNYVDNDVVEALEDDGYALEWDDEWGISVDNTAFRVVSSEIGWMPSFFVFEGELYPIKDYEEKYVEEVLKNNYKTAGPDWLDLSKYGFVKSTESNSGYYDSCENKSPESMAKNIPEDEDYVFKISNLEPWCMEYELWTRKNNKGEE